MPIGILALIAGWCSDIEQAVSIVLILLGMVGVVIGLIWPASGRRTQGTLTISKLLNLSVDMRARIGVQHLSYLYKQGLRKLTS